MTVKTFSYTGAFEDWVVPAGVSSLAVDGYGAGAKQALGAQTLGGRVQCTLPVTAGETLRVSLGGTNSGLSGGFNGGGVSTAPDARGYSTGGAGATDIRQGGTNLASRIIVMGGAGGDGGSASGGNGGGLTGQAGGNGTAGATGGGGGTPSAGGNGGQAGTGLGGGGNTGTQTIGGFGGAGAATSDSGGGGGGGYWGGGGGGGEGGTNQTAGTGGGGSSFTGAGVTGVTHTQGYALATGNGALTFTYTAASAPSAPTLGTITPGDKQLSAAFTAGSDGGSAITTYKYSTDNGSTYLTRQTGSTASPIVITKLSSDGTTALTNGVSYTVIIKAVNAVGDGTASNAVAATPVGSFTTLPSVPSLPSIGHHGGRR